MFHPEEQGESGDRRIQDRRIRLLPETLLLQIDNNGRCERFGWSSEKFILSCLSFFFIYFYWEVPSLERQTTNDLRYDTIREETLSTCILRVGMQWSNWHCDHCRRRNDRIYLDAASVFSKNDSNTKNPIILKRVNSSNVPDSFLL